MTLKVLLLFFLRKKYNIRAIFSHKVASGTDGGSSVAATWTKLPINTEVKNDISGASLASNVVTLPAGTYSVRGLGSFFSTDKSKIRLRDTTNSTDLIVGNSTDCDATNSAAGAGT